MKSKNLSKKVQDVLDECRNLSLDETIKILEEEQLSVADLLNIKDIRPDLTDYVFDRLKKLRIYANEETILEDVPRLLEEIETNFRGELISAFEFIRSQVRYETYAIEAVRCFDEEIYLSAMKCQPEARKLLSYQLESNPNIMLEWAMTWPEDRNTMLKLLRYCYAEHIEEPLLEEYLERFPQDKEYLREIFEDYVPEIFENSEEDTENNNEE